MEQEPRPATRRGPPTEDPGAESDSIPRAEIEKPAELIRLAHMVRSTLDEVRTMDLDEGARHRLSDTYNRTVTELRGILSDDLQDELDDVAITTVQGAASSAELRVVHAQLVGWLQGLFQGNQASMTSQMLAAQQQNQPTIGPSSDGHYL